MDAHRSATILDVFWVLRYDEGPAFYNTRIKSQCSSCTVFLRYGFCENFYAFIPCQWNRKARGAYSWGNALSRVQKCFDNVFFPESRPLLWRRLYTSFYDRFRKGVFLAVFHPKNMLVSWSWNSQKSVTSQDSRPHEFLILSLMLVYIHPDVIYQNYLISLPMSLSLWLQLFLLQVRS